MFRTEASVPFQKAGSVRTQSKFWGKYVHTLSFWLQVAVTLGQDTPATNSMSQLCSVAGFIELILGLLYFLSETWNKESVRNDEIFLEEPGEAGTQILRRYFCQEWTTNPAIIKNIYRNKFSVNK
ncbi:hypothetical protein CHARACLAT_027992 [Characodon lateralis]|uniref:Uncharacterized protein n=1 Tax=Characodon lateralis TaxID=208331 RepID=A0ABU7ENH4_9TELE|nr:hypothetical protein [Characodon lateralis]